jgi:1-acyl-sn-glycerol-3-phosphate acyltransferase
MAANRPRSLWGGSKRRSVRPICQLADTARVLSAWHTDLMVTTRLHDADSLRPIRKGAVDDRMAVQAPVQPTVRYDLGRFVTLLCTRLYSRVRVEGRSRLPAGPFVLCFSHQNWADPIFLVPSMPGRPQIAFFGPEQEEMRRGVRNRLMRWAGVVVPYQPGNRGLIAAMARAHDLLRDGRVVAIAGEGRIHAGEGAVLPLRAGTAYLALRAGVPVVPVALNGTSWLGFRRVVRVRIGMPIAVSLEANSRPTGAQVDRLVAQIQSALQTLVADFPDQPAPGPIGRWLTERFNDWPEGTRPPNP